MRTLKLAVIGAGHLGRIHARLLAEIPEAELIGIVDPDSKAASELAASCHTTALASHLEVTDQIDAAIVAAPTRLHHRIAIDLLSAGIHTLVEKPIASSVTEADRMVAAAERHHTLLQVGHVERFNPIVQRVLPQLSSPRYIESLRCGPFTFRSTDIGVVHDLMIHDIDLALSLVRSPVFQVEAMGASVLGGHEDLANARLTFENGCIASLSASRVSYETVRRMQVFTPTGYVNLDFGSRTARSVDADRARRQGPLDVDTLSPQEKKQLQETFFDDVLPLERIGPVEGNAIAAEQADFVSSILHSHAPRVCGTQGRDALAVADQIVAAIDAYGKQESATNLPAAAILPGPHWTADPAGDHQSRREAG